MFCTGSRCIFKACPKWRWFENHPPHSCFTMCLQGCGHMVIMFWLISFRRIVLQWCSSSFLSIFVFVGWRWWKQTVFSPALSETLWWCGAVNPVCTQETGNLSSDQNVHGQKGYSFGSSSEINVESWNVVFLFAKLNLKTYFQMHWIWSCLLTPKVWTSSFHRTGHDYTTRSVCRREKRWWTVDWFCCGLSLLGHT